MAADSNIVKRTLKTTALYKAVLADNLPAIQQLLKENPKLIYTDYMHESKQQGLLYIIFKLGKLEMAQMLMNEHPDDFKLAVQKDQSLLDLALDKNKPIELVNILIQNGVDVNCVIECGYGETMPLFKAVEMRSIVLVNMLIKAGANPDAHTTCMSLEITALYKAVKDNNIEIARMLVESGANVNIDHRISFVDSNLKATALHWAVHNNNTELAKILIEAGANLYHGNAFLKTAVKKDNIELVKLLIAAGAYVDLQRFNLGRISNEMQVVLVNYPSHVAREQKIWQIWDESDENKPLSIQNDDKVVDDNDKEEISQKTSVASLSDKGPAFFFNYRYFIQWLPKEVLRDTLDLVVFPEVSPRKK